MNKDQFLQFNQMATGTHKGIFQGVEPTHKQFKVTGFSQFTIVNGQVTEQ
jgi:hypothetical protein